MPQGGARGQNLVLYENKLEHRPDPEVIKLFFMLNSTEHEIYTANKKLKYRQMKTFPALSLSDVVFIMLINVRMPTIVGILTIINRINFVLS